MADADSRVEVNIVGKDLVTEVLNKLAVNLERIEKAGQSTARSMGRLARDSDDARGSQQGLATASDKAGKEVEEAGQAARRTARAVRGAGDASEDAGRKARKSGDDTQKAARDMDLMARASTRLKRELVTAAASFIGVSAAIAAVRSGVRTYLEFGRAVAETNTILREGSLTLGEIERGVLDLSLALGQNETIVQRGFYGVLSAGIEDAADASKILEASLNLAVGGFANVESTVDAVTSVINAYGFSADEATRITDVLFRSVDIGKARIEELSSALSDVIPFSSQLGITIEEVSAAVTELTRVGTPTAEAVNRVRAAIVGLLRNAEEIDELFRERLGRSFTLAEVGSRGLVPVLQDIRRATNGSEVELTKLLGRVEGVGATLVLTANEGQSFARTLEQIQNSAGATQQAIQRRFIVPAERFQVVLGGLRQGLLEVGRAIVESFVGDFGSTLEDAQGSALALRETIASIGPVAATTAKSLGGLGAGLAGSLNIATLGLRRITQAGRELTDEEELLNLQLKQTILLQSAVEREWAGATKAAEEAREQAARVAAEIASIKASLEVRASLGLNEQLKQFVDVVNDLRGRTFDPESLGIRALEKEFRQVVAAASEARALVDEKLVAEIAVELDLDPNAIREELGQLDLELEIQPKALLELPRIQARRELRNAAADFDASLLEFRDTLAGMGDVGLRVDDALASAQRRLREMAREAVATGAVFDRELAREVAVTLGLDAEEFTRETGLLVEDFKARFRGLSQDIRKDLAEAGTDLSFAIDFEDVTGRAGPALREVRQEFTRQFTQLAEEARVAGVQIPEQLLGPLTQQLIAPDLREAFRAQFLGILPEPQDLALGFQIDQEALDAIKAQLERLKAEQAVLQIQLEVADDAGADAVGLQLELARNQAEQTRLAFEGLRAQGLLGDQEQAARQMEVALAAVNGQLRETAQASQAAAQGMSLLFAGAGQQALNFAAQIAIVTGQFVDLRQRAEAVQDSMERIDALQRQTLPTFEAQASAIRAQAREWARVAEERLAATDPAQYERELEKIREVEAALLRRNEADRQAAALRVQDNLRALEVQAGLTSAIEADREAIKAQTQALIDQAGALGLNADEVERLKARITEAGTAAADAVGTFSAGFARAAQAFNDPEALGARVFGETINLAGEFGRAIAEGGDAFDRLKERAVGALLEIGAQLLAAKAIDAFGFGGPGAGEEEGGGAGEDVAGGAQLAAAGAALTAPAAQLSAAAPQLVAGATALNAPATQLGIVAPALVQAAAGLGAGAGALTAPAAGLAAAGPTLATAAGVLATPALALAGAAPILLAAGFLFATAFGGGGGPDELPATGGGGGTGLGERGGIVPGKRVRDRPIGLDMARHFAKSAVHIGAPAGRTFEHGGILGARGGEPGGGYGIDPALLRRGLDVRAFQFGGVAQSPTLAVFAEKPGMAEAFVPLGPNRKIPVEIREGGVGGVAGGGVGSAPINVTLHVQSLDPRTATDLILGQMPVIQQEIATAIQSGRSGQLVQAVRDASGRR